VKKVLIVVAIVMMFGLTCSAAEDWQKKAQQTEVQLLQAQINNIDLEIAYMQERARTLVGQKKIFQDQLKVKQNALNPKVKDKK